jgi:hypothetical protein
MIRAILAGDEEIAAMFTKRCAEMVTRWTPAGAGNMDAVPIFRDVLAAPLPRDGSSIQGPA